MSICISERWNGINVVLSISQAFYMAEFAVISSELIANN